MQFRTIFKSVHVDGLHETFKNCALSRNAHLRDSLIDILVIYDAVFSCNYSYTCGNDIGKATLT